MNNNINIIDLYDYCRLNNLKYKFSIKVNGEYGNFIIINRHKYKGNLYLPFIVSNHGDVGTANYIVIAKQ